MKKIFILSTLIISSFLVFIAFSSCKKVDIKDSISEITKIYFKGESEHEGINGSISVGQRENPYIVDGIHQKLCDFSLVELYINSVIEDEIYVNITINNKKTQLKLFYNSMNASYVNDLGYKLNENDEIIIEYQDQKVVFTNISKDFFIDYNKALEIANDRLSEEIKKLYDNNIFQGECYLKILKGQREDFGKLFWYYNIFTIKGENFNVVISVENGEVVISN